MARKITLTLGKAKATAELLDSDAPKTCELVLSMLPVEGRTGHTIESGKEVLMEIGPTTKIIPENQTIHEIPGDVVMYLKPTIPPPSIPSRPVISFIYERDAQIRSLHGPIPVNLFARITSGLKELGDEAVRMRREGYEKMRIIKA
jgi:hypothetical protein